LAQLQVFSDVPVVPVTLVHQHVALGGPIWPDFAGQTWVRHCRAGEPVDQMPALPEGGQRLAELVRLVRISAGLSCFLNGELAD
jgi:hypothetical protein